MEAAASKDTKRHKTPKTTKWDELQAHYEWIREILSARVGWLTEADEKMNIWLKYKNDTKHGQSRKQGATGAYLYFNIHDAGTDAGINGATKFPSYVLATATGIENFGTYELKYAGNNCPRRLSQNHEELRDQTYRRHYGDAETQALISLAQAILAVTRNNQNQDCYPSIIGTVILASTQGPCTTCRAIIGAFKKMFPGISLAVVHPYRKEPLKCTAEGCCQSTYGYLGLKGDTSGFTTDEQVIVTFFAQTDAYVHWDLTGLSSNRPTTAGGMSISRQTSGLCCNVDLNNVVKKLIAPKGADNLRTAIHTLECPSEAIDGTIRLVLRGAPCSVCRAALKYGLIAFFPHVTFDVRYLKDAIGSYTLPSFSADEFHDTTKYRSYTLSRAPHLPQDESQQKLEESKGSSEEERLDRVLALLLDTRKKVSAERSIKTIFRDPENWKTLKEYIGYKRATLAPNHAVFAVTFRAPNMKSLAGHTGPWTYLHACRRLFAHMKVARGRYALIHDFLSAEKVLQLDSQTWETHRDTWETVLEMLGALRNDDSNKLEMTREKLASKKLQQGSRQSSNEPLSLDFLRIAQPPIGVADLIQLVASTKQALGANSPVVGRLLELGFRAYISNNKLQALGHAAADLQEGPWETQKRRGGRK